MPALPVGLNHAASDTTARVGVPLAVAVWLLMHDDCGAVGIEERVVLASVQGDAVRKEVSAGGAVSGRVDIWQVAAMGSARRAAPVGMNKAMLCVLGIEMISGSFEIGRACTDRVNNECMTARGKAIYSCGYQNAGGRLRQGYGAYGFAVPGNQDGGGLRSDTGWIISTGPIDQKRHNSYQGEYTGQDECQRSHYSSNRTLP